LTPSKLLLGFAAGHTGKPSEALDVADLNTQLITAFLDHLESDATTPTTPRNARLAAIRSLFRFAVLRHPEHAEIIHRGIAIPTKRTLKPLINWLTDEETDALVAATDPTTWTGRPDRALISPVAVQAGLRAQDCPSLRDKNCPRPATHRRHATPACRHRYHRHRLMSGSRPGRDNQDLPPRRSQTQTRGLTARSRSSLDTCSVVTWLHPLKDRSLHQTRGRSAPMVCVLGMGAAWPCVV